MEAGFGKGTIVFPESLFPLEGFSGVHDDPHVRLMVLKLRDTAFALLEAELVIVPQSAVERWRDRISEAFGILREYTAVQMTHTFTTPHEPGPMGPPDRRPAPTEEDLRKRAIYHEAVDRAVEEAISETQTDLSEVVLGWGSGDCPVNVNCDVETPFGWWLGQNPAAYSNHTMTVLRCETPEGALKGLFISFGMKPAAIDNAGRRENRRQISSEVSGAFCNKMEATFGVPVIYAVSAGGNQVPVKSAIRHETDASGEAHEIDEGVSAGLRYADEISETMLTAATKIANGIRCETEAQSGSWQSCSLSWTRRRGGPRTLRKALNHTPEGETLLTAELFHMGETSFVMVRPEMTAECERLLQSDHPDRRMILMTLTNGEMKCLPDQASFDKGTYEAQGSNLMPGAAEALMKTIKETMLLR